MKIQISDNHDFDKWVMIQETKRKLGIYEPISEALQSPKSHAKTLERINDIKDALVKGEESVKVTCSPSLVSSKPNEDILLRRGAELNLYDACEKVGIEILNSKTKLDPKYNFEDIKKDIKSAIPIFSNRPDYAHINLAFALEKLNSLVPIENLFCMQDIKAQQNIHLESLGSEGLEDFLYRMCKIFNIEIDVYFPKKESVETQTDELVQKMHNVAIQKDDIPLEKVKGNRFYLEDDQDEFRAFALNKSNSDISDLEAGFLQREKLLPLMIKSKTFLIAEGSNDIFR